MNCVRTRAKVTEIGVTIVKLFIARVLLNINLYKQVSEKATNVHETYHLR